MKISQGKTVSIAYTMSFESGEEISTNKGGDPLVFVQGGHDIFSGLEQALEGLEKGAQTIVTLSPGQAYGEVDPDSVIIAPIEQLPEDARETGAVVETQDSEGQMMTGEVTGITEESVTIDFNHPLAGQTIQFDITVMSVAAEGGAATV
ncbi:MAG TPA: peptidylprolyl isomerase [Desulfobacteraceae bacterium]|nr:peptidylprolyl isomerase [Desulfobacteraceae bacterium]